MARVTILFANLLAIWLIMSFLQLVVPERSPESARYVRIEFAWWLAALLGSVLLSSFMASLTTGDSAMFIIPLMIPGVIVGHAMRFWPVFDIMAFVFFSLPASAICSSIGCQIGKSRKTSQEEPPSYL